MGCDDPLALGIVAGYALWVGVARGEEAAKPPLSVRALPPVLSLASCIALKSYREVIAEMTHLQSD